MKQNRLQINLGAGHQDAPGWIAYDRSRLALLRRFLPSRLALAAARRLGISAARRVLAWPDDTRVHDVTKGLPHATGSVDAIYTSHMLEHLSPGQGPALLRECHRVLRPGGTLRIVVPDLEVIARAYVERDRTFFASYEGTLAEAFVTSLELRPERRGSALSRVIRVVLRTDDGGHSWLLDGESLEYHVRRAGFEHVERVAFGEGQNLEAAALDHRSPYHVHLEAQR